MSKATWWGLILAGATLGLVTYLLTRGLDDGAVEAAKASMAAIEAAKADVDKHVGNVEALVKEDATYMKGQPAVAEARTAYAARKAEIDKSLAGDVASLKKLLEEDSHSDSVRVGTLSVRIKTRLNELSVGADAPEKRVRDVLDYKKNHEPLVKNARAAVAQARKTFDDGLVAQQMELSTASCPESESKLQARYKALEEAVTKVTSKGAELEQMLARTPLDYVATGTLATALATRGGEIRKMKSLMLEDFAGLARSEDRILIDMREKRGRYEHKYRIIENGVARETGWQTVSSVEFHKHKSHLGMAIYSKPECTLKGEAVKVASPPGYNYVGNTRYGRWERRGSGNVWVFYGKYALMRDLLWGRSYYSPVRRSSFNSYRSNLGRGRSYFGEKNQWGTRGTTTKKRFKSSSYMKRSASRSSYSGSSYSGSRSSSSSRSGGYRSSRYRSSSFGGSGK